MSAWIVSRNHITSIVLMAIKLKTIEEKDAEKTGQMLWEENYRSVNHRYAEDKVCPKFEMTPMKEPSIGLAVKAIGCLDYQSCERNDWDDSEAKKLLDKMYAALDGDKMRDTKDYQDAPWGID